MYVHPVVLEDVVDLKNHSFKDLEQLLMGVALDVILLEAAITTKIMGL